MGQIGKITLNTIASSIGRVAGGLLALVSIGFITRSLGASGFGEYATVVAYLSTFNILADLGLYSLLTKEIAQKPDQEKELVSQFFTLRLIVAVLFLFIAVILAGLFPYSSEVKVGIAITASGFLFLSLSQIFLGVFQKYIQIYKAAISEFVGRAVQLGFVWYFFTRGEGLLHFLWALVISTFVIFALNFIFARELVSFKLKINLNEWKRILKETYPIAASLIFTLLYFKADTLLLSVMRPAEDVGIYNAAYKVLETIIFFPAAFMGLMLPRLSSFAKENKNKLSETLAKLTDLTIASALPVFVGGTFLSYSIASFIGGSEFLASGLPLQILFLAIAIIFFGTLYGNTIIAMGLQKKAMWAYFIGFIVNFIANIIVIPRYSYIGTSWTTVLTEFLVTIYLVWIIKREVKFTPSLSVLTKATLSVAFMGIFVFYVASPIYRPLGVTQFIFVIFGGCAIYTFFAWRFGFLGRFRSL